MAFDFASFAAGLVSGALVGVLAGYLHETEAVGELQERVRTALLRLEQIASKPHDELAEGSARLELRNQLLELQEDIKRLYRREGH